MRQRYLPGRFLEDQKQVRKPRVLLINPTIVSRRHARFPLSLLALANGLERSYESVVIDGNVERETRTAVQRALATGPFAAIGMSVMGGPQIEPAIELSRAARAICPATPIVWGGYFPTLNAAAAMNASYVDYAIRGPGEETFVELLERLGDSRAESLGAVPGLSWRSGDEIVHNADRKIARSRPSLIANYPKLGDPRAYLTKTVLGRRTAAHQAALGCRFRCTFCGVAAMFGGATALPSAQVLEHDLHYLKHELGADSVQFYDHNFFDREMDMVPLLEVMAKFALPWWCYARSDALLDLSSKSWSLVRQSRLRMAYIGAESPNDQLLREIRKGTKAEQTLEVAKLCRRHGVIPELSFMVAPPEDPVGETERTFEFIRQVKRVNPEAEIIVYIYTPLPPESVPASARRHVEPIRDADGNPVMFPKTPEEWTQRHWVDYACHANAPWVSEKLLRRIRDFVTVMRCRFPTVQDVHSTPWKRTVLRTAASWRYLARRYDRPWELKLAQRLLRPADPRATGL
jgi:radical SAM superfamily enzyme YgiQ (UPF0313 family)